MPGFQIAGKGGDGPVNTEETHRIHRWSFDWYALGKSVYDYALSCTRPVMDADTVTIHHRQNEVYLPGKHKWLPIRMTLYTKQKDTLEKLNNLRKKTIDPIGMKNFSFRADSVSSFTLSALDGKGVPIWVWKLNGAWVSKIEHPAFNYENSDLATVDVTIVYDYAEEQ